MSSRNANNRMKNLFRLLNDSRNENRREDQRWTVQERRRLIAFGENEPDFEERFGEANTMGRTRITLSFDYIRVLTAQITSQLFNGTSRYEQDIRVWYEELTKARAKVDKTSLRGYNVKGVVAALLYLHIRKVENTDVSIPGIIDAANRVRSEHKYPLDRKTFDRCTRMVLKYLSALRSHKSAIQLIQDHINQIGNKIKLTFGERRRIIKYTDELMLDINAHKYLTGTNPVPNTVARVLIFIIYPMLFPDTSPDEAAQLKQELKITKTDEKKWVPVFDSLVKNIST